MYQIINSHSNMVSWKIIKLLDTEKQYMHVVPRSVVPLDKTLHDQSLVLVQPWTSFRYNKHVDCGVKQACLHSEGCSINVVVSMLCQRTSVVS